MQRATLPRRNLARMRISLSLFVLNSLLTCSDGFVVHYGKNRSRDGSPARVTKPTSKLASAETSTNDDDTEALLEEINELSAAFEIVQDTMESNAKLYEEKMDEYEEDIEQLKAEITRQIMGIVSRDNDIKELKAKLSAAETQYDEGALFQIETLNDEIDTLRNEIESKDFVIENMKNDLSIQQVKVEDMKREIIDLSDKTSDNSGDPKLLARIDELEKKVEETKSLEKEVEDLKSEAKKREDELMSVKGELEVKIETMRALSSKSNATGDNQVALMAQKEELEIALENSKRLKDEVTMYKKQAQELNDQLEKYKGEVSAMKEEVAAQSSLTKMSETEKTILLQRIEDLEKAEAQNMILQNDIEKYKSESEQLRQELANQSKKLREKEEEVKMWKQRCDSLEGIINDLQVSLEQERLEVKELRAMLEESEEKWKDALFSLERENEQLSGSNTALQRQVQYFKEMEAKWTTEKYKLVKERNNILEEKVYSMKRERELSEKIKVLEETLQNTNTGKSDGKSYKELMDVQLNVYNEDDFTSEDKIMDLERQVVEYEKERRGFRSIVSSGLRRISDKLQRVKAARMKQKPTQE